MSHTIEHKDIEDAQRHEPKGASTATSGTVYVSDGAGSGSWTAQEGTAILSTGEAGATKFLREDGDGTSSWQVPAVASLSSGAAADKTIPVADGAGGIAWQTIPYQGVYDDNIGAATTITGSGAAMTRISAVVADAAATATGVDFTANADGSITYTGTLSRHFHVACTISIDISAATNVTCQAQLQKYDDSATTWAAVPGTNVQFNVAASSAPASTAIHGDVMLDQNDKLVLAIENIDAATDLQLVTMYLFAMGMPGT